MGFNSSPTREFRVVAKPAIEAPDSKVDKVTPEVTERHEEVTEDLPA